MNNEDKDTVLAAAIAFVSVVAVLVMVFLGALIIYTFSLP